MIGWIIFHETNLHRMADTFCLLFGATGAALADYRLNAALSANAFWLALALVFCAPLRERLVGVFQERFHPLMLSATTAWANLAALTASVALLVGNSYNPFIYFRF
jgi:alginate O-acetyltransferase complex protein AlgI